MSGRVALIAGATGLVGSYCLRTLLEHPAYEQVVVFTRRPIPMIHPKLDVRVINFDKLLRQSLLVRVDDAFCAIGTTRKQTPDPAVYWKIDVGYVEAFAAKALESGATRLAVVSAIGADPGSRMSYSRFKGDMERRVSALPFQAVHIFRPGLLLGERHESRFGETASAAFMKGFGWAFAGRLRPYRAILAETVGQAMVGAALSRHTGVHVWTYDDILRLAALTEL